MTRCAELQICPSPVSPKRVDHLVAEGVTVADALREHGFGWVLLHGTRAVITIENGHSLDFISPEEAELTYPSKGDIIGVRVVQTGGGGGGGKNPLATVLSIAVMAASVFVAAPLAAGILTGINGTVNFGATALTHFGTGLILKGFISGAITMLGNALISALAPPQSPNLSTPSIGGIERGSTTYSITGAKNKTNKYGKLPFMIGGKTRIYPPYAAEPYTEAAGEDQYLRMRFAMIGPVKPSDFKIGETPIEEYSDVELEYIEGWDTDEMPTLYADGQDIHEEEVAAVLTGGDGPVDLEVIQSTACDEIQFDFEYDALYQDDDGTPVSATIQYRVESRIKYCGIVGTSAFPRWENRTGNWTPADETWTDSEGYFTITDNSEVSVTKTKTLTNLPGLPSGGQLRGYDLRFTRWSEDDDQDATLHTKNDIGDVRYYQSGTLQSTKTIDERLPFTSSGGTSVTRVTQKLTKEITFDMSLANLFEINSGGTRIKRSVDLQVVYREVGSLDWLVPDADWCDEAGNFTIEGKYLEQRRFTYRFLVDEGQYEVRWRRITEDAPEDDNIYDEIGVGILRSIANHPGIDTNVLPPLFVADLRIKATGQLNGVVDAFNFIGEAYLPVWNGVDAFEYELSDSPAWAYVNLFYGKQRYAQRRVTSVDRYDTSGLEDWADLCEAQGWKINAVCDFASTVSQLTHDVCSVGRASRSMVDDKYGVSVDWYEDNVRQIFTPRNSWGFQSEKVFNDELHAVKCTFVSAELGYQQDEQYVYADGYDELNATQFDQEDFWGITEWDQVWQQARTHMADAILRPEVFTFNTNIQNIRCTRGDRIRVVHDIIGAGLGQGRIKSLVTNDDGDVTAVNIDSSFAMDTTTDYAYNIQMFDGSVYEGSLRNPASAGEETGIVFNTAIPQAQAPVGGELITYGESDEGVGIDCKITRIDAGYDEVAKITCREYAPEVFTAADGAIPEYDPHFTYAPNIPAQKPETPVIDQILSDESVIVRYSDGTLVTRVIITINQPQDVKLVEIYDVHYKASDSEKWTPLGSYSSDQLSFQLLDLVDGDNYDFRIRAVSTYGVASDWATEFDYTVIGKTTPPPAVGAVFLEGSSIAWSYEDKPVDHKGYLVRYTAGADPNWAAGVKAHDGYLLDTSFDISKYSGSLTWMVKALDLVELESDAFTYVVTDLGEPTVDNIIVEIDYQPTFSGMITGGTITGGVIEADDLSTAYLPADSLAYSPSTDLAYESTHSAITYTNTYSPDSSLIGERMVLDLDITNGYTVFYRAYKVTNDPAYTPSTDPAYMPSDENAYGAEESGWLPWPGSVIIEGNTMYEFQTIVDGGSIQGEITEWTILIDTPDLVEALNNVTIDVAGTPLPITETFRNINYVNVRALQATGTGVGVRLEDKAITGPTVKVVDGDGTSVGGVIDCEVGGY